MKFTVLVAAELTGLTAALDEPGADIGAGLLRLAAAAGAAVSSYLGLSVVVSHDDSSFASALLEDGVTAADIGASIVLALPGAGSVNGAAPVTFVLYARIPGAFVDLAADTAWLTGRPLTDFALDEHLAVPDTTADLAVQSLISQATGVLIGRGYTPHRALRELDTQAGHRRTDRLTIARFILARLSPGGEERFDIH